MRSLSLTSKIIAVGFILSIILGFWEAWYQGFIVTPIVFVFLLVLPTFMLSLIAYVIILLLTLSSKYKDKFKKTKRVLLIILIICLIFVVIPLLLVKLVNKINSQIGERIIEAVELYKEDNGRYPDGLDALIPTYTPEIPKNLWGNEFRYEKLDYHEVWSEENFRWDKINTSKYRLENSVGSGWYVQIYDSYDKVWFLWD